MLQEQVSTTSPSSYKFVIIGAGPTGLGAAYRLKELGEESFLVLEGREKCGGLASSYTDSNGFTWDIGGHVQFSHYDYFDIAVDKAVGDDGWYNHRRSAWIRMLNRFIPYPIQKHFRHLPKDLMWECLRDLIKTQSKSTTPKNFDNWCRSNFGNRLSETFFLPYNLKVWAHPPEMMDFRWIGERVATVDLVDTIRSIIDSEDKEPWGPNSTFRFPKRGGTGAIWEGLGNLVGDQHIRLNSEVIEVDCEQRYLRTRDGHRINFGSLLSTAPINQLVEMLRPCLDQSIIDAANGLHYSSTHIVGIGIKGSAPPHLADKSWMYFPESDSPFYRATVFSNYSPNNVPRSGETWSLMLETSASRYRPLPATDLVLETIKGCQSTGLIGETDTIVSTWRYSTPYGYPIPTLARDTNLKKIFQAIEPKKIYSRGRFGAWKYEVSNQDHSFMQGVEWVNRLLLNIPETTCFFPEIANSNWGRSIGDDRK